MATHEHIHLDPFWDEEYKTLYYKKEQFNDPVTMIEWEDAGFRGPFGGYMCDMRHTQPSWNKKIVNIFMDMKWNALWAYFRFYGEHNMLPKVSLQSFCQTNYFIHFAGQTDHGKVPNIRY